MPDARAHVPAQDGGGCGADLEGGPATSGWLPAEDMARLRAAQRRWAAALQAQQQRVQSQC